MTIIPIYSILEAKVKGLGEVCRLDTSFDQALEFLRDLGVQDPISLRDLAYAIREVGIMDSLCYGNYTKEGFLYFRNEPVLLALNSPFLDLELARQAVKPDKKRVYFSTDRRIYEQYKEIAENEKNNSPEERNVFILSERESYKIPTNKFNENELTRFLFRDQAENYGKFLREIYIYNMPVWLVDEKYVDNQEESVLTQLWFHDFRSSFGIQGNYGSLGCTNSPVRFVFGKPTKSAEF